MANTKKDFCPLSGTFEVKPFQKSFNKAVVNGRYRSSTEIQATQEESNKIREHFGLKPKQTRILGINVNTNSKVIPSDRW